MLLAVQLALESVPQSATKWDNAQAASVPQRDQLDPGIGRVRVMETGRANVHHAQATAIGRESEMGIDLDWATARRNDHRGRVTATDPASVTGQGSFPRVPGMVIAPTDRVFPTDRVVQIAPIDRESLVDRDFQIAPGCPADQIVRDTPTDL